MSRPTDFSLNIEGIERDELEVDVVIVGAGPAGLSTAIRLAQLCKERGEERAILVLEKGEYVGSHSLSGAVMDPRGITDLFPDFKDQGFPFEAEVTDDWVEYLTGGGSFKLPITPPPLRNHGNLIISVNRVTGWLRDRAEELGVDIYPGFAVASVRYAEDGRTVIGVQTRDAGIDKHGQKKPNFEPGMDVTAGVTVFAEGTRGSLAKGLIKKLGLDEGKNHQLYETGVKEIWEVTEEVGKQLEGKVIHTMGAPLGTSGYGGGWIYGLTKNRLSIGYVVGLDHTDPGLDPHSLFVSWKQHPAIQKHLTGGKVLRYGAKTIPGGGYFAMPRFVGDGFVLVGDSAGFVNMQRLKGVHLAIHSGMLAAEGIAEALAASDTSATGLKGYVERFEAGWGKTELYGVRNFRQSFQSGFLMGMVDTAVSQLNGGRGLKARRAATEDHLTTRKLSTGPTRLPTPKFDDAMSMDKLTDVYHSGSIHEEDQPAHLLVLDPTICVERCTTEYGNPCQHFCPAAVYEWGEQPAAGAASPLAINFSNCVHCKTCDIADPYENIEWTVPEGGGGPKYTDM
ncbi:MAG: electron transfer flavoprotein-ubiquinone oxidoreductase [Planctomycetota bacterium]|nr:electron transfer flavoprotein-ubiquinone oxidoreductase [Planctomycetota bacterium]